MSIFFIIFGTLVFLVGIYLIFKFLAEFKLYVDRLNEIVVSEDFRVLSSIRDELDELNNSYYDILERQDERITNIELMTTNTESAVLEKDLGSTYEENSMDTSVEKQRILSLIESGKSINEVARLAQVDVSTVELICSLSQKES